MDNMMDPAMDDEFVTDRIPYDDNEPDGVPERIDDLEDDDDPETFGVEPESDDDAGVDDDEDDPSHDHEPVEMPQP